MAQENDESKAELEATVDKAIETVLGDRASDSPSGEQPTQEATDSSTSPSVEEIESGTEAAAAAEPPKPWFSDADKELAASYGFGDDDLKDFADQREFNRVARLLDKQLLASVQREQPEPHKQNGHEQAAPTSSTADAKPAKQKFTKLDLDKLKEVGHDPETIEQFKRLNDLVDHAENLEQQRAQEQARVEQLEQNFTQFQQLMWQAEQQRRANAFHDAIDNLGDERFGRAFGTDGKPTAITKEQDEARRKLYETVETLKAGLAARGQQIPAESLLLRRAKQVAFAEDIAKEAVAKRNQEIAAQSKLRRPVQQARNNAGQFASKKPLVAMNQHERISAVAADPDLQSLYHNFVEANGATVS